MRDAKLPLAYRDSCANLLIPLNNCRFETYYLPWKCEVGLRNIPGAYGTKPRIPSMTRLESPRFVGTCIGRMLTARTARETHVRKVSIRRVQATGGEDERATGGEGRCKEQLDKNGAEAGRLWQCTSSNLEAKLHRDEHNRRSPRIKKQMPYLSQRIPAQAALRRRTI